MRVLENGLNIKMIETKFKTSRRHKRRCEKGRTAFILKCL